MEALRSSEEMLSKATQLWTMLDDMAENNPGSYRQFMQQQLKEAKQHYAPPEPWLCLKTCISEPTKTCLFINLCSWNRIPAPKSPLEPILLSAGKMETLSDNSEIYSILDIAYNPSVLERVKDNPPEKDQLIHISLKYIEEHFNVTLSHSWSVAKFKLKGSLERMRESLRKEQPPLAVSQSNSNKEVTPNQLRSLMTEDSSGLILPPENPTASKKHLIEEISTTDKPEVHKPAYEMTTKKDADEEPLEIELRIELPDVCGVSECNLNVSKVRQLQIAYYFHPSSFASQPHLNLRCLPASSFQDDVLVECLEKYRLQVDLPVSVDEEATSATFYKKKGILLVRMPVYKGK
ncbi:PIH1 domain-containing protein 2 isoform X1 [Protobothrops mucrosquamatus]|uniref:PIH1 domain-containing protein 2 isoform X1 n=1 Tax=Protobothrops mucrosquamatus TaxID=103944 RepID=UPI0007757303|nr:PIH1 domain-containing protein 2 isoform X1 [Protobothrops mucrosquamatus]